MIFKISSLKDDRKPHEKAFLDKEGKYWNIEIKTLEELLSVVDDSYGIAVWRSVEDSPRYEINTDISFIE